MKAGLMRSRLRIESPIRARDNFGSPVKSFQPVTELDAQISAITGREYFGSDRELGELTWKITFRSIPGETVEPSWRGVDVDSRAVYDFVAVLPSRQKDYVTIAAKSGSSAEEGAS